MNSAYRTGHIAVILAAITSTITAAIFVGVLLCASAAHGQLPDQSRTMPLLRTDGATVIANPGVALPRGTVALAIKDGKQSFTVDAYNLSGPFDKGLGVYLGTSPQFTNGVVLYVDVLSQVGTNDHWHLGFTSTQGAPAQLGVPDLTDLVGLTVFVATETNKAVLRAYVVDLVPDPAKLSFRRKVPLVLPDVPLSQKAKGSISVKYNGRTGSSIVDIRARGLNANNRYQENGTSSNCVERGILAVNGNARWGNDTGRGDELYVDSSGDLLFATDFGDTTVYDIVHDGVIINDCFGGLHLWGMIPGPKKK